MSNVDEAIQAAERIVQDCLKGHVVSNADLELARKLEPEYLMKAMINAIFEKQAMVNKNREKRIDLIAIGDLNYQKAECAYRDIPLTNSREEKRVLEDLKKQLLTVPIE